MKTILIPDNMFQCPLKESLQDYEYIIHLPTIIENNPALVGILNYIVDLLKEIKDKLQNLEQKHNTQFLHIGTKYHG